MNKNKITVKDLRELLSKYNDNEQVILYTGAYLYRGRELWVETEQFKVKRVGKNTVYLEGNEAH